MKPAWMAEFHSENCKNIFKICTDYNMQTITKQEARDELNKCDLSNLQSFKDYVQKDISNIYKSNRQSKAKTE